MKWPIIVSNILRQKITLAMYFSAGFFLVCMTLDYSFTNVLSQGDYSMEANSIARWWWQIAGSFRFVEIPIYVIVILGTAYIINYKNKFFPLFWLNLLAFNHLVGFFTWLPYGTLPFADFIMRQEWATVYSFSFISIFLSSPLTTLQFALGWIFKKIR